MQPSEQRFWKYVSPEPNSGCWLWDGAATYTGHGKILHQSGRLILAHRLSWTMHRGEIPSGLLVRHKCDNPRCVNPDHLCLGTHKDNSRDAVERGRISRGTKHGLKTRGDNNGSRLHPERRPRGENHWNFGKAKAVCKNGHPFAGDNVALTKSGKRVCRQCGRMAALAHYHRKQALKEAK